MRLYNLSHKSVGKAIKQGDSFLVKIPPVGEFVEVDDKHLRKLQLIVDKSFGRLSLNPPHNQVPAKQAESIVDLQTQLRLAMEEIERLKNMVTGKPEKESVEDNNPDENQTEQVQLEKSKKPGRPKKEND